MENVVSGQFWSQRPVLVTGATGFLGSHLTASLVDKEAQVVVLSRAQVPVTPVVAPWIQRVTVVKGDVRDQALMERVMGEYEVATVFHLAAQTQVEVANRNPVSTFESNVKGTWSLMEAVRRSPTVEQVVVASSDKAYGAQPVLPYSEEMPLLAVHPYDVSKAAADMITFSYSQVYGVPASVTRCGNFFGPGDTNWSRLVPGTIRGVLRGQRPLIRSDGTPLRDYLYVADGALAYLKLAETMATDQAAVGQAFNFSLETPVAVLDLVRLITRLMDRDDLEPEIQNRARYEIDYQHLSAEKAKRILGWRPEYSLEAAMKETIVWYRDLLVGSAGRA